MTSLNYSSIRTLSVNYQRSAVLNLTAFSTTLYLKADVSSAPFKVDVGVIGLNFREDYTIKQYCVNEVDIESQTSVFIYSTDNINDEESRHRAVPLSQGLVWGLVVGLLVTLLLIFCVLLATQYKRSQKELKLLTTN